MSQLKTTLASSSSVSDIVALISSKSSTTAMSRLTSSTRTPSTKSQKFTSDLIRRNRRLLYNSREFYSNSVFEKFDLYRYKTDFRTNHARDEAGNPDLHLMTSKKDQFLVHIKFENEIDFLFGAENCLTRFNIGVMKSEMDFSADYTHCVANTLWWTAPVIEE
jgi:hypothetical protein